MDLARRLLRCLVAGVAACTVLLPTAALATSSSTPGGDESTIVASEGPVRAPEVGPILVPTDDSAFGGAWWLVAFGGVQLVGLFFITRRARARLSTEDARP
ncbi:MAG: hypothetical protein ACOYMR_12480 [Ilumatobacteraceae bacterium]|jgi:hypothetical protein